VIVATSVEAEHLEALARQRGMKSRVISSDSEQRVVLG